MSGLTTMAIKDGDANSAEANNLGAEDVGSCGEYMIGGSGTGDPGW